MQQYSDCVRAQKLKGQKIIIEYLVVEKIFKNLWIYLLEYFPVKNLSNEVPGCHLLQKTSSQ